MVKAVDLLFRFSIDLDINLLCYIDKCKPILLWKNESDGAIISRLTTVSQDPNIPMSKFCVDRGPLPRDFHQFYYVWYRADECFPWNSADNNVKSKSPQYWTGVFVHATFYAVTGIAVTANL